MTHTLASLLTLCVLACSTAAGWAASYSGTVTRVRDGDSVQITTEQGTRLEARLNGIDAPERAQKDRRGQPYAEQSRDTLNRLALNRRVTFESTKSDQYGRRVGVLTVETGNGSVDAGLMQVQLGMAWTFPRALPELPDTLRESYQYAEAIARAKRRGLWADDRPQPPWVWRPGARKFAKP